MRIHLVSLGCARNLVDSETMTGRLVAAGHRICDDPAAAEVIIVNTCSFIETAVEESIDTILELAEYKTAGSCRRLVVAGCLPERFREGLAAEMPEVDVFLGTGAYAQILNALDSPNQTPSCLLPDPDAIDPEGDGAGRVRSSPHLAYLKIAEGCDRHCTYCIIPKLRGRQKSRAMKHILDEAAALIRAGVKELVLVAQETSAYGKDLGLKDGLAGLLRELSALAGDNWIRVLYGHPASIDLDVIRTVHEAPNVCSYFDIPVQHASQTVLRRMGRRYGENDLLKLFETIRSVSPEACLRTTLIVGFPGETDADFKALLQFVKRVRFHHLGVFTYSDAEDLPAHKMSDHVPEDIAKRRYDAIMSSQAEISLEHNRKYLGKTVKVLVEEQPEAKLYVGRTAFQAPEVDGVTFVSAGDLQLGAFADVCVTDALAYDLTGETQ